MTHAAKRLLTLLAWAILALALTPIAQTAVGGSTAHRALGQWGIGGDWIVPWDFESRDSNPDNVDWAVDVFFTRNATISRVKGDMDRTYAVGDRPGEFIYASPMQGVMNENDLGNTQWHWDSDHGKKTAGCAWGDEPNPWGRFNVLHYRIYAPARDYIYNQAWGQWVYGTTHIDHKECGGYKPPQKWSGRSELAEAWLAAWGRFYFGSQHVREDAVNLGNGENRQDSGHWWENNGRATLVEVCLKNGGNPCGATASAQPFIPTATYLTIDQVLHGSPGVIDLHGNLSSEYSMQNRTVHVEFDNADYPAWNTVYDLPVTVSGSSYFEYKNFGIPPGNWNVRARYAGDEEFNGSQSGVQFRTVKKGYQIVNRKSGMCLSLSEGWKNYNGQPLIQWPCAGAAGQVFSFWEPFGNGWYNLRANGHNRCVDVTGVSLANGAYLQSWDCLGAGQHNQQWRRVQIEGESDRYGLLARHADDVGQQKCMDVLGGSETQGTRVGQWDCWWGYNQRWALQGVN